MFKNIKTYNSSNTIGTKNLYKQIKNQVPTLPSVTYVSLLWCAITNLLTVFIKHIVYTLNLCHPPDSVVQNFVNIRKLNKNNNYLENTTICLLETSKQELFAGELHTKPQYMAVYKLLKDTELGKQPRGKLFRVIFHVLGIVCIGNVCTILVFS